MLCDVRVLECWESGGGAVLLGVCGVCDVRVLGYWESGGSTVLLGVCGLLMVMSCFVLN